MNKYKLFHGDCIKVMKSMEDCCVDAIVTDPPYHLTPIVNRVGKKNAKPTKDTGNGECTGAAKGFLGKKWDGGDISFQVRLWEECFRILKPGGHLLSFSHSRTYHRMAVAIEDSGFDIKDQIMWIHSSGFPKSHNIGKLVDKIMGNKRTPYIDYDLLRRKKRTLEEGMYSSIKGGIEGAKRTRGNSPWEGWGTALKPSHEPIALARKPLSEKTIAHNVIKHGVGGINIDKCRVGKEEIMPCQTDNGTKHFGGMQGDSYTSVSSIGRWPANLIHDGSREVTELFPPSGGDSAARFFYCAKTSKKERNTEEFKNTHPTVKPISLMSYLCKMVTPPDGLVLDPFMGSGSTGVAALQSGFHFIGIDMTDEYFDIAKKRINAA